MPRPCEGVAVAVTREATSGSPWTSATTACRTTWRSGEARSAIGMLSAGAPSKVRNVMRSPGWSPMYCERYAPRTLLMVFFCHVDRLSQYPLL